MEASINGSGSERHFRVVRFYADFSAGVIREEVASGLSLEEAERVLEENAGMMPGEEYVIQDELATGLDAEIETVPYQD